MEKERNFNNWSFFNFISNFVIIYYVAYKQRISITFTLQRKTYSISLRFKYESRPFRVFLIEDPFVKGLTQERTSMLTFPDAVPKFQATLQTMSIHQSSIHLQIHDAEAYYPAGSPVRFSVFGLVCSSKRTEMNSRKPQSVLCTFSSARALLYTGSPICCWLR